MQTVTLHTWQTYFPLPLKAMVKRQPNFTPKSRRCLFSHPTTRAAESWGKKRFSFSQNWNKSHWTLVISCCPPPACESSSKHYFWCVKLRGFLQLYGYTASPLLTHSWKLPLSKQDFNFLTSQSCFWSPPKPWESYSACFEMCSCSRTFCWYSQTAPSMFAVFAVPCSGRRPGIISCFIQFLDPNKRLV